MSTNCYLYSVRHYSMCCHVVVSLPSRLLHPQFPPAVCPSSCHGRRQAMPSPPYHYLYLYHHQQASTSVKGKVKWQWSIRYLPLVILYCWIWVVTSSSPSNLPHTLSHSHPLTLTQQEGDHLVWDTHGTGFGIGVVRQICIFFLFVLMFLFFLNSLCMVAYFVP